MKLNIAAGILVLVGFLINSSIFVVNQWETAIMFRLGQIVRSDYAPGLHFKVPFINEVTKFDERIQTLDSRPERFLTEEKKNLEVDSFIKWRIVNTAKFFTAMGGSFPRANQRLSQILKDSLRAEFASRTVQQVISDERAQIRDNITKITNLETVNFGIEIVDVRIKRTDLPQEVSESVYRRMEAERNRVAKELRSEGSEKAERIQSRADRDSIVLTSTAYKEAQKIRGEGDATSADIYAKAYNKDREFYSFYRSINAYTASFNNKSDVLLLDTNSQFFDYFTNSIK